MLHISCIARHWATASGVQLEGDPLPVTRAARILNLSPRLTWGYRGGGPHLTAFAILLSLYDQETALEYSTVFAHEHVAQWPQQQDYYVLLDVDEWLEVQRSIRLRPIPAA